VNSHQEAESGLELELIATRFSRPAGNPTAAHRKTLANANPRLIARRKVRASSIRAQGEAEAEIIFKKGEAEAKGMNVKAEAFQEYNQARARQTPSSDCRKW